MQDCPKEQALEDYQAGRLAADKHETISQHLDSCDTCQAKVESSRVPQETVTHVPDVAPTSDDVSETAAYEGKTLPSVDETVVHGSTKSGNIGGIKIAGYEITGRLGEGGMGTVWRAVQQSTKREVALKLMNDKSFESESARFRFEREVELAARLEHPNIAQIYEAGIDADTHYYAMQLVDGKNLDKFVKKAKLSHREIVQLMLPICRAVEAAHRLGVIHRDLKPSNVVVSSKGHPIVLDFGLAKSLLEDPNDIMATRDGQIAGTPAYMAPEQARGDIGKIDTRSDVYALGVILFRLLTGEMPHDVSGTKFEVLQRIVDRDIKRPREANKEVDSELEAILLKALSKPREDRYGSAGGLANDLERYLKGDPLDARPATALYFLGKQVKKHRVSLSIALATLLGLICLGGYAYVHERSLRTKADAAKMDALDKGGKAIAAAERARQAEVTAKDEAKRANVAEALARSEAEAARRQLYFNRIALATQYSQTGRWWKANELLDACPKDLRHWEWGFLKQQSDRLVRRVNVGASASSFTFTPDDELLLVGTWYGTLSVVDSARSKLLWSGKVHDAGVLALTVGENGRLATVGADDVLHVWQFAPSWLELRSKAYGKDIDSDELKPTLVRTFPVEPTGAVEQSPACALSADGTKVARAIDHKTVIVNEVDSGKELFRCVGHSRSISDIAFSHAGDLIATIAFDGTARIWEDDGKARHALRINTNRCHPQLRLTKDGTTLFVAARELSMFDTVSGELRESMRPASYDGIGLTSTGEKIVVREHGDLTSVVDQKTRQTLYPCLSGTHREFAISHDGRRLAHPVARTRDILIVDTSSDTRAKALHDGSLAVSPTEDLLALSSIAGRILIQKFNGQRLRVINTGGDGVDQMQFSEDGKMLAARVDGVSVLWDLRSGERYDIDVSAINKGADDAQSSVSRSRFATVPVGSDRAYAITTRGSLAVWLHQSDELIEKLSQASADGTIVIGQGARMLAFVTDRDQIEIWDRLSGKRVGEFPHAFTTDLSLSPNGQLLVASDFGSDCKMWDLETGELLYQIDNVQGPFAFSPDSSRLLAFTSQTRARKNTLRLLSARSGDEIMEWEGVDRGFIQFSSDGRQVVASRDQLNSVFGERLEQWQEGTEHDLLACIDPSRDEVAGKWELSDGAIKCESAHYARIRIPVTPLGNYQLTSRFTRLSGGESVGFYLPVGPKHVMLHIDGWASRGGFTSLLTMNGHDGISDPTAVQGLKITDGVENTLIIHVTSDGKDASITSTLNGADLFAWEGPLESLGLHSRFDIGEPVLGLYAFQSDAVFHSAKLKLVQGNAELHCNPSSRLIETDKEFDVLQHILVDRDLEQGEWLRDGDALISGSAGRNILLAPIEVRGSYEFAVDFTPIETTDSLSLLLPTTASLVAAQVNSYGGRFSGLYRIDGRGTGSNETTIENGPVESGTSYRYTARVHELGDNRVKIEGELDGNRLYTWTGTDNQLSCFTELSQPHRPAISSFKTKYRVTGIKFRLIDGEARLVVRQPTNERVPR